MGDSSPESTDTQQVLRKLLQDHVGEGNGITQAQLSDALGLSESAVRDEIAELKERDEPPCIGNFNDGYFVITDPETLQKWVNAQKREIETKERRLEANVAAFNQQDTDDLPDPESDADDAIQQGYDCAKCGDHTPRDSAKWPKQGPYEDQVVCKSCYGKLVVEGQA